MAQAKNLFTHFSNTISQKSGHPVTFAVAVGLILVWAASGPIFHFSDTWQLVINTSTTIITFLMVFLIQNTQNRDNHALQLKLDEVIRAMEGAHNSLLCIEEMTDEEICKLKKKYLELAKEAITDIRKGRKDTGHQDIGEKHV